MIGTDVVGIERLRRALANSPGLEERLYTAAERAYCRSKVDPAPSFAGTMAAKEAVMKALGTGSLPAWARRIEIVREGGRPHARIEGRSIPVSISHDAGVATAVALVLPAMH